MIDCVLRGTAAITRGVLFDGPTGLHWIPRPKATPTERSSQRNLAQGHKVGQRGHKSPKRRNLDAAVWILETPNETVANIRDDTESIESPQETINAETRRNEMLGVV